MEKRIGNSFSIFIALIFSANYFVYLNGHPLDSSPYKEAYRNQSESYEYLNDTNDTNQDLLVIRTVVYEIGILTNSDDNDTYYSDREQVDLTFFDPATNGTAIDLSNIPIPIQTNFSGVSITGVAPADLGIINLPEGDDGKKNITFTSPVLPHAIVSVSRHVSTDNQNKTNEILSEISPIVDIPNLHIKGLTHKDNQTDSH